MKIHIRKSAGIFAAGLAAFLLVVMAHEDPNVFLSNLLNYNFGPIFSFVIVLLVASILLGSENAAR